MGKKSGCKSNEESIFGSVLFWNATICELTKYHASSGSRNRELTFYIFGTKGTKSTNNNAVTSPEQCDT